MWKFSCQWMRYHVYFDFPVEFGVAFFVHGVGEYFYVMSDFLQFDCQSEDLSFAACASPEWRVNHGNSHVVLALECLNMKA